MVRVRKPTVLGTSGGSGLRAATKTKSAARNPWPLEAPAPKSRGKKAKKKAARANRQSVGFTVSPGVSAEVGKVRTNKPKKAG